MLIQDFGENLEVVWWAFRSDKWVQANSKFPRAYLLLADF